MAAKQQLSVALLAPPEQIRSQFYGLVSRDDVAKLLEIPPQFLRFILFGRKERGRYTHFNAAKKDGTPRLISVPPTNIAVLQRKLNDVLSLVYRPRQLVTGFVRGRSIATNASLHVGKRHVFNFDLEGFFPSIHLGRIRGTLIAAPYHLGYGAAETIAQIATMSDGRLPQGGPSSPIISNMVCSAFDSDLLRVARKHRCSVSRYADDITLSTSRRYFPLELAVTNETGVVEVGLELAELVARHSFAIKPAKTRLRSRERRQRVTGLVVNEFVNIPRNHLRNLRAMLWDWKRNGAEAAGLKYFSSRGLTPPSKPGDAFVRRVLGKLEYVRMVRGEHDPVYRKLVRVASTIRGRRAKSLVPIADLLPQALRGVIPSQINWQTWVDRYRDSVFLIRCHTAVDGGDQYATAFQITSTALLTAGHNCERKIGNGSSVCEIFVDQPLEEELPAKIIAYRDDGVTGLDMAMLGVTFRDGEGLLPIPFQERIPVVGEEIAVLGFPTVPYRGRTLVLHIGRVEAIVPHVGGTRFLSLSFSGGGGLSGSPVIDRKGFAIGVMVQNVFHGTAIQRPYGQAILLEHWRDLGPSSSEAVQGTLW